jgi:hypothetical protein
VEGNGSPVPGALRSSGWNGRSAIVAALLAAFPQSAPATAPEREAWRKVEAGRVTVVGTASDAKLVETAVTLRALVDLLPGLVPGALGAPPPLVVAVAHDAGHLARVGLPAGPTASGRVVLASTGDEEARPGLLRAATTALVRRAKGPLPAWVVAGLAEYLSTFTTSGTRATLGRLVPEDLALLRPERSRAGRPGVFTASTLVGDDAESALHRAEAWALVHYLFHGTPDGAERLGRFAALLAAGGESAEAFREAFGEGERARLVRARSYAVGSKPLARFVPVTGAAASVGRILPLTRAGAAGLLGGVARGRRGPETEVAEPAAAAPTPSSRPSPPPRLSVAVSRDVPAEVDLVNRLIDEGREEEALARLEALHASLGSDPEMQRALGWDVQEVRRVVVHNRLVRRYNEAIGLFNAGRWTEALPIFREVAGVAEDPGLRRLAWERANTPAAARPR